MQSTRIVRQHAISRTPRVAQLEGLFDVPRAATSRLEWDVHLELPEVWSVGAVVGPSGSGKTTLLRELWPEETGYVSTWSQQNSIVDDFPGGMGIKEVCGLLSSVGFSSPPSWLRPFQVLSTGEQFRCSVARRLAESHDPVVIDEFTSTVDRIVAKVASNAIAKAVRRQQRRLVVGSCHYDILDWLEPDWAYEPHLDRLQLNGRGRLWRRPSIELSIQRVHRSAWQMFKVHHYLSASLSNSSTCFAAFWGGIPCVFTAVLPWPGGGRGADARYREHRTVCLPDYQGVGMGNSVSDFVGSIYRGLGYRYFSITSHPAMIGTRNHSPNWICRVRPNVKIEVMPSSGGSFLDQGRRGIKQAANRFRATFEYVGPSLPRREALDLLEVNDNAHSA